VAMCLMVFADLKLVGLLGSSQPLGFLIGSSSPCCGVIASSNAGGGLRVLAVLRRPLLLLRLSNSSLGLKAVRLLKLLD
jgi:hypothetical protein